MLCHDMLTSKAAMANHIEFIHGIDNEPNSKSHPAVCVFIVESPIPIKMKLTNTKCVTLGKKTQLGCEKASTH